MGNAEACPGCGAIVGGWDDDAPAPCACETGIIIPVSELQRLRAKCNRLIAFGEYMWAGDIADWPVSRALEALQPGDMDREPSND